MDEVEVTTIPIKFIKKLTVFLENDTKIYFYKNDLHNFNSLEELLHNVSISEQINDIYIEIDLPVLESTIEKQVNGLLNKENKDD